MYLYTFFISIFHNSQKEEAAGVTNVGRKDEGTVGHVQEILSLRKEGNSDTFHNIDECSRPAKWSTSGTKGLLQCDSTSVKYLVKFRQKVQWWLPELEERASGNRLFNR